LKDSQLKNISVKTKLKVNQSQRIRFLKFGTWLPWQQGEYF